eukprot:g606.t1
MAQNSYTARQQQIVFFFPLHYEVETVRVDANFKCKNASSNWPTCVSPQEGYDLRFGKDGNFPITAWWGPVGYDGDDTSKEFEAYVSANFTIALVSDRSSTRCTGDAEKDSAASWISIQNQLAKCEEYNIQGIVDTYRFSPWGGIQTYGSESQGTANGYVKRIFNHKITLRETMWLASRLVNISSAVGLLITDDGVDLAKNEIEEIQWMRENTPALFPWVNQCGDGTPWLARAGTPYAVPELYSVKGPGGDANAMASALLGSFDDWTSKSDRYDLKFFPLINVGDGGDTGFVRSRSLTRFSAYAAVAYGAKGLNWYCWGRGIYNLTSDSPSPIYSTVRDVNSRIREWGAQLLAYEGFEGAFHTGNAVVGPASSSWSPASDALVTNMSDDLLVGVLSIQKRWVAEDGRRLFVVVDKRVDTSLNGGGPERIVTVTLAGGRVLRASLLPGDASIFEVEVASTCSMRRWRNDGTLRSIRTTQYEFYQYGFKALPQTTFPIGVTMPPTSESNVESLVADVAGSGYNVVLTPSSDQDDTFVADVLNAGLRHGVFALSMSPSALSKWGCHPSFGGFLLNDGDSVSTLRHDASHLLATVRAGDAESVRSLQGKIPAVCVEPPSDLTSPSDVAQAFASMTQNMTATTFIGCSASNLIASTALAFGAKGLIFMDERNDLLALNLANVWGSKLLDATLSVIASSGFVNVPGVRSDMPSPVVRMDHDLTLSVFEQGGSSAGAPPMYLVTNQLDEPRVVRIDFNTTSVAGWTSAVGCSAAGFNSCSKMVYGATVEIALESHGCELFYITMYEDDDEDPGGAGKHPTGYAPFVSSLT